jgi:AraC family transcriptional regulator of arabinose operon
MINISGKILDDMDDSGIENLKDHLSVNCCGYQKFLTKSLSIARNKGRHDYQIIYIAKGKCLCTIDGLDTTIQEGNIILFKPNEPQYYSYSSADSTETYWIHFTGYGVPEYLGRLGLLTKPIHYIGLNDSCIELFKLICHELQIKNSAYPHIAAAYLYEIISTFSRILSISNENKTLIHNDIFQSVIQLMHSKYSENLPISYYANKCNLSLYRFIHKFKQHTGMSPLEYITNIRINTAKDLLSSSSLSISEVSSIVGYENPLYFSRIFKKVLGSSPSSFKDKSHSF